VLSRSAEDPASRLPAVRGAPGDLAIARPRTTRWTPRFRLLLGVLLTIGVGAVAAVVVLALDSEEPRVVPPPWSDWAPSASGAAGAQQIAQHVSPAYRLGDGRQLVQVGGGPLEVDDVPLDVAVRRPADAGGDIQYFDDGGVMYRMCGLGPECSIAGGKVSTQRGLLLGREGLELALYSLRYLDVKSVVVLMPPPPGESPNRALFFRRDDLTPLLARPLSASLPPRRLTPATMMRSPDAPLVATITTPRIFTFSLTRANTEGRGILVLTPIDADASQPAPKQGSDPSSSSGG